MRQKISITLDERLLAELNKRRGLIPLSRFVEEILKKEVKGWKSTK